MLKFTSTLAPIAMVAAMHPSVADEDHTLVGTWKVVSFEMVSPTTGERESVRGEHPSGYTIFTPKGRMSVLITNEGRKAPTTDQDRAVGCRARVLG